MKIYENTWGLQVALAALVHRNVTWGLAILNHPSSVSGTELVCRWFILIPGCSPWRARSVGLIQVSRGLWFLSPCLSKAHRGSPSCVPELADGPGRTPDARLISLGFLLLDLNCVVLPFFVSPPLVFSRSLLPQYFVCLLVVCSGRLGVNNSICHLLKRLSQLILSG